MAPAQVEKEDMSLRAVELGYFLLVDEPQVEGSDAVVSRSVVSFSSCHLSKRSNPAVDFQFHGISGDVPAQKVCRREGLSFPECQRRTCSRLSVMDLLKCITCQTDKN